MTVREVINIKIIDTDSFDMTLFQLFTIILFVFITIFAIRIVKRIFKKLVINERLDKGSANSIFQIIKYIIWTTVIGLILQSLGINLTILIAGSAALLVGLGLGVQQIFNDVASGFFLLFERNLKVGDIVEIENGIIGKVIYIGLRTSKVKTRDSVVLIVPNSKFVSDTVINWSHMESLTRFNISVGVEYGTNTEKVKDSLLACAYANEHVSKALPPEVRFKDFADSALLFQLFFYADLSIEVEIVKSELRFAINKSFAENGIKIPFPQTDVHIKKD
ncbi:MAG: mechanosensitive ion channel [Bacteroidales bacterium]|nr:mechanosensitive ion channel [Bacteroidales bacterium]